MKKLKEVVLCDDDGHCCPMVSVSSEGVSIRDDFGGSVKMTSGQFRILKEKISKGEL